MQTADSTTRAARGGGRWAQLRARTLSTPEGTRNYEDGYRQARSYRETMRVLNTLRARLGVTQEELAARMHRRQPTVARLLTRVDNPTLGSLGEVLHGLGLRGRLVIEAAAPGDQDALIVEVRVPAAFANGYAPTGRTGARAKRAARPSASAP